MRAASIQYPNKNTLRPNTSTSKESVHYCYFVLSMYLLSQKHWMRMLSLLQEVCQLPGSQESQRTSLQGTFLARNTLKLLYGEHRHFFNSLLTASFHHNPVLAPKAEGHPADCKHSSHSEVHSLPIAWPTCEAHTCERSRRHPC